MLKHAVDLPVQAIESRVRHIGRELLAAARRHPIRPIGSEKLIAGALEDEAFKTALFRFVDVFPALKTPDAIHRHLVEYLQQPGMKIPTTIAMGLKAGGLLKGTLARTVAGQITGMAKQFIAGKDLAAAAEVLAARWKENIAFSLDILGEACVSHAEAAAYRGRYLRLIEQLPVITSGWGGKPLLETDHLGSIPRTNISLKISALDGHVSTVDADNSIERLVGNIAPLLHAAKTRGAFINFDMEHYALKNLTIDLFKRCCETFDFDAGIALQAYLTSADADAHDLVKWARDRRRIVTVRLIKGAYWDYETIHAQRMNWPSPVWPHKWQTDACFERVTNFLLQEIPREVGTGGVKVALGTHNMRSVAHAMACVERVGLPKNAIEFQALRGMADDLKLALADNGWRVREYQPMGDMIPGMAYLVRRLLENTSNEGWLRGGLASDVSDERRLRPPTPPEAAKTTGSILDNSASEAPNDSFHNEPVRDFSQAGARDAFRAAIAAAIVPQVEISATPQDAAEAIAKAESAFPAWRNVPQESRSAILQRAAEIFRDQRDALSAMIVRESAKTWAEADGDVCEAIDFCAYYAREAITLFMPQPHGNPAGERNYSMHEPRGVAAIISPWNFSLSIPAGMTVAALVTGNAAILKPAEQTPAIARRLCEILWQAGIPRNVLHFLPGSGETTGAALVRDPRIAIIAFTGSAAVGMDILHAANQRVRPEDGPIAGHAIPRIICEMGGKNAIIIDDSADFDEAVPAVRQSAFSYSGQKCSAASRLIVVDSIHDAFIARLIEATRSLIVGSSEDPATDIGPVIDAAAAGKIRHYIALGQEEATQALPDGNTAHRPADARGGNFIDPHIFIHVLPGHRIAREEIFGPVLAVLRAKDFDQALALANDSAYKLTGGVFSRTPSHLAQASREFRVGNLYLNRGITGALVGRQPFGGFGLSGVGSKAGGPDYLRQFTDPRTVTENMLRRGFAPTGGIPATAVRRVDGE